MFFYMLIIEHLNIFFIYRKDKKPERAPPPPRFAAKRGLNERGRGTDRGKARVKVEEEVPLLALVQSRHSQHSKTPRNMPQQRVKNGKQPQKVVIFQGEMTLEMIEIMIKEILPLEERASQASVLQVIARIEKVNQIGGSKMVLTIIEIQIKKNLQIT